MRFRYEAAREDTGERVKGVIEAESCKEAVSSLASSGMIALSVRKEPNLFSYSRKKNIGDLELSILSRDIATYLSSGIALSSAIDLARKQYKNRKRTEMFLSQIASFIKEGESFYTALEKQKVFHLPDFYKKSIKIAEGGGTLPEVLINLSNFLKERDAIAKKVRGALSYPSFIAVSSVLVISFMMAYVVPNIVGIFSQTKQELPAITKAVIAVSGFLESYWPALFGTLFLLAAAFFIARRRSRSFRRKTDAALLRVPIFGNIVKASELSRFSFMVSLLVSSGVPFVQAVSLSAESLSNEAISEILSQAASKMVEGSKLSSAISSETETLDDSFVAAIALAEETSKVPEVLKNLSVLYKEENAAKIDSLMAVLEPSLMLMVGGIVGTVVAAMLLPIFSMSAGF